MLMLCRWNILESSSRYYNYFENILATVFLTSLLFTSSLFLADVFAGKSEENLLTSGNTGSSAL